MQIHTNMAEASFAPQSTSCGVCLEKRGGKGETTPCANFVLVSADPSQGRALVYKEKNKEAREEKPLQVQIRAEVA